MIAIVATFRVPTVRATPAYQACQRTAWHSSSPHKQQRRLVPASDASQACSGTHHSRLNIVRDARQTSSPFGRARPAGTNLPVAGGHTAFENNPRKGELMGICVFGILGSVGACNRPRKPRVRTRGKFAGDRVANLCSVDINMECRSFLRTGGPTRNSLPSWGASVTIVSSLSSSAHAHF